MDTARLAALVRAKRGDKGLRAAAEEIGEVSPSTLSRIEQGRMPDVDTFFRLCRWLGVSADELAPRQAKSRKGAQPPTPPEQVEVYLRADRTLRSETVEALVQMVKLAYKSETKG